MPVSDAQGLQNVWTISSPSGGTVITGQHILGTASGNTIAGLLNATNGRIPLYIKRAVLTVVSGTLTTGCAFVWGVSPASQAGAVITSTGATAAVNNLTFVSVTHGLISTGATIAGPVAQFYAGDTTLSVLAGTTGASIKLLRPFGGGGSGAVATGAPYTLEELPEGELAVNPGCFVGLFIVGVAPTGLTVLASLTWSEGA